MIVYHKHTATIIIVVSSIPMAATETHTRSLQDSIVGFTEVPELDNFDRYYLLVIGALIGQGQFNRPADAAPTYIPSALIGYYQQHELSGMTLHTLGLGQSHRITKPKEEWLYSELNGSCLIVNTQESGVLVSRSTVDEPETAILMASGNTSLGFNFIITNNYRRLEILSERIPNTSKHAIAMVHPPSMWTESIGPCHYKMLMYVDDSLHPILIFTRHPVRQKYPKPKDYLILESTSTPYSNIT